MATLIEGRVVGPEGPVAGARVVVDDAVAAEPFHERGGKATSVVVTNAAGEFAFDSESYPELVEKQREAERARMFPGYGKNLSVRATHGKQSSVKTVFEWNGDPVRLPDLKLEPGVLGRIALQWGDGATVVGLPVLLMLSDQQPNSDERAGSVAFQGPTDPHGAITFGPVPDREYRFLVQFSHPEAPPRFDWWDSRIQPDGFLIKLERGRTVRGRLTTAQGEPAEGYRVAAFVPDCGDPEGDRVAEADADGRFELAGVASEDAVLAYYDQPPARSGPLVNPLLLQPIPDESNDVGTVVLPELGTLALQLRDARGGTPRSGHAHWFRHHPYRDSSRGSSIGPDGIIHVRRVPLGTAIQLDVTIEDPQHGEIRQRFEVAEAKEETMPLTITGAGTVVLRLHSAGAPHVPLEVTHGSAQLGEYHGLAHGLGRTSELRGWATPGEHPSLTVKARGYETRVLESFRIRDDGPTFVDVALDPVPEPKEAGEG